MFGRYLKARLAERDTHVVALGALYTVLRMVVPPEYLMVVDTVAGVVGAAYAGTPIKTLK